MLGSHGRRKVDNHEGLPILSEAGLQQVGELGVAEGNVQCVAKENGRECV